MELRHPFNIGLYGKSKSGKSHLIEYILKANHKQFNCVIIIAQTIFNGGYDYVKKIKGITYKLLTPQNIDDKLKIILKTQTRNKEKEINNKILIVLDDIIGLFKFSKISRSLNGCYRHYNISLIVGFQVITACDVQMRINHSHACLFKMTSETEYKHCKESFLDDFDSIKEVKYYLTNGFDIKYKFLFINRDSDERCFTICPKDLAQ